ncbi:peptidase M17 [Chitinophaga silvatica]|uniref:Peptidase M17 n=2 Tax=Chitinophaga silvatica TaxID=2282649 RepID=A0A3E1YIE9_9BACT|nr:peptidase M17 [Chitinophaga silvatica]
MFLLLSINSSINAQQTTKDNTSKSTPEGTAQLWGVIDGLSIEGLVEGPATATVPLQIACVFEYTEGDIFNPPALPAAINGMVHLDKALNGQITELRKSGKFAGHFLETLLIEPPKGAIKARQLLLIGLGDRNKFNADLMISVGRVAFREAARLSVKSFAIASDLKDAGIDSPTALVAANITKGIIDALHTQLYLKDKKLYSGSPVVKAVLLAGPSFFITAGVGIKAAIDSFKN